MSDRRSRSVAEWCTFAVSCVVLAGLIGLIAVQLGPEDPPAPEAHRVGPVRVVGGQHHVRVAVTNEGGATAANVQVTASLVIDGETTEADQTVDFLAGDETEDLVFVFDEPPEDGELVVEVAGYSLP
jgi:uncharacterized protein (TIGR02588 family)